MDVTVRLAVDASSMRPELIGNKAAGLIALMAAGFAVPKGFCVTTEVFARWRQSGDITESMRQELSSQYRTLTGPLAVRSSSPVEDRADASFAGQYQTILGVRNEEEFFNALLTCWRSASSEAATSYAQAKGWTEDIKMAVVVQELVPATTAGVLFTMHPVSARLDHIVVNANFGLGESVVSGRAEPDTFILEKQSGRLNQAKKGSKRVISVIGKCGVEESAAPSELQAKLSLGDAHLGILVDAARRLEAYFDLPMDVEWAFCEDELFLLQARPITTGLEAYYTDLLDQWARDRQLPFDPEVLWRRGSPLSSLPVSPLYYSEMAAFFSDMFPRVARIHGQTVIPRRSFRYFGGYSYQATDFASAADPSGDIAPIGFLNRVWWTNLRIGLRHPRTLAFWANIDAYYRKWNEEWLPAIERNRPVFEDASIGEIRCYIEFLEVQRRQRSVYAALGVAYAANFLGLLAHLVTKWTPGAPDDTIGILTSGIPQSLTHEENVEIESLLERARECPEVCNAITQARLHEIGAVANGATFLRELEHFRTKRPHRGCSDRDILQPRWGDSPDILLMQLQSMLSLSHHTQSAMARARTVERRCIRESEILTRLGRGLMGAIRRFVFTRVLRTAQRYWIQRDNQRHSFDRYFYELRRSYRAIGVKLVAEEVLNHVDDIFFLGKTELYAYLDSELSKEALVSRANWRKVWWQRVSATEPPAFLKDNLPYVLDGAAENSDGDLKGMGGAPGVVTGPIRVIRSMSELGRVKEGEILVTQAIDPAWTPVFGLIGGVISEEGGILSHATVLGREYGIPVVIGVRDAMTLFKDQECVSVNGTTGVIRRQ